MNSAWQTLVELLPPAMRNRACLAGGFVANPKLANDVDLWVLSGDEHQADWDKHEIDNDFPENTQLGDTVQLYEGGILVKTIPGLYAGKDVQILVSPYKTALELVENFDISTHAIALQGSAYVTAHQWTPTTEQPRLMRVGSNPASSLARLQKICARYGFKPLPLDVVALQDAIARAA